LQRVRVAVIGTGNMGQHHARIYSEMAQVELVGIVEINELRGRQCAARYRTQFFPDYRDLFDKVDAVNIVVPTSLHYEIAKDFLEHDVHVLVEKPITVDIMQAKRLVSLAKRRNLVLQVGHLERFNPAVALLKQFVKKPLYVEAHRLSYPSRRNTDVGVIWDLMIHDLDILLNLVNSPVEHVTAVGRSLYSPHEDLASVQVHFGNGCVANLVASRISGERLRQLQVVEEDGDSVRTLSLDFINQTLAVLSPANERQTNPPEYIPIKKEEPLRLELEHFTECVTTNRTPLVSGEDGKRALELAISAVNNMTLVNNKAAFAQARVAIAG
jgi:predicted dehydrogenase